MKRDIVNQLTKLSQKAWEDYVKLPTNENREKFERIDDDLRVELEFDRTVKFNSNMLNGNTNIDTTLCNG